MITCRHLAELLLDYLDGELPPDLKAHIDKHLQQCPPCVTYLETYQVTIRLTRKLPQAPLPPHLGDRLRAALDEYRRSAPPP